ncbi:MAG: hypothetical protein ABR573_08640 [Candidatus Dormibacteria bacterium]
MIRYLAGGWFAAVAILASGCATHPLPAESNLKYPGSTTFQAEYPLTSAIFGASSAQDETVILGTPDGVTSRSVLDWYAVELSKRGWHSTKLDSQGSFTRANKGYREVLTVQILGSVAGASQPRTKYAVKTTVQ